MTSASNWHSTVRIRLIIDLKKCKNAGSFLSAKRIMLFVKRSGLFCGLPTEIGAKNQSQDDRSLAF